MKNTKPDDGFRLSNLALLAVIGVLGVGILLDGILYNKAPPQTTIHPIADAKTIEVNIKGQPIVRLTKTDNQWLQTHPIKAPARSVRVQPLLDTNKYNQRSYTLAELPHGDIFTDKVTLKIDAEEYHFGAIEPVSNLRYVLSGDRVYLQPDTVLPMLSAVDSVFMDLRVTNKVEQLTIDEQLVEQPEIWSDLTAVGIVDISQINPEGQPAQIKLMEENQTRLLTAVYSDYGYTITSDKDFTYLLSNATATTLGLTALLPSHHQ